MSIVTLNFALNIILKQSLILQVAKNVQGDCTENNKD